MTLVMEFWDKGQLAVDFCLKISSRKKFLFRFDFPCLSNGLLKTGYHFRKHGVSKIEIIKKCQSQKMSIDFESQSQALFDHMFVSQWKSKIL